MQKSRVALKTLMNALFADNTTGNIVPASFRSYFDDLIDSFANEVDQSELRTAEISLSSAQILTGNSLPIELIPSPGPGFMILPVMACVRYNFDTAAYATNTTFDFLLGGTAAFSFAAMISQASDRIANAYSAYVGITSTINDDEALIFQVQTGDPTAGGGDMNITIIYKVIQL